MKPLLDPRWPTFLKIHELKDTLIGSAGPLNFLKRRISHEGFDGMKVTYPFEWGVLERGESVAALIHDPVADMVAIVEQLSKENNPVSRLEMFVSGLVILYIY